MDNLKVLNDQLIRMRQMNRYYHQQFLTDVRLIMIVTIAMLVFVVVLLASTSEAFEPSPPPSTRNGRDR